MRSKAKLVVAAGLVSLAVLAGFSQGLSSAKVHGGADVRDRQVSSHVGFPIEGSSSTGGANRKRYVAATNSVVECARELGHEAGSEEQYGLLVLYSDDLGVLDKCETAEIFEVLQSYEEWYMDPQGRGDVVRFECLQRDLPTVSKAPYTAALLDEEINRISATANDVEAETLTACMMDPYARSG